MLLVLAVVPSSTAGDLAASFKEAVALAEAQGNDSAVEAYQEHDLGPYYKKNTGHSFSHVYHLPIIVIRDTLDLFSLSEKMVGFHAYTTTGRPPSSLVCGKHWKTTNSRHRRSRLITGMLRWASPIGDKSPDRSLRRDLLGQALREPDQQAK